MLTPPPPSLPPPRTPGLTLHPSFFSFPSPSSSATFSLLAILCAIISAATAQYRLETRIIGTTAGFVDFGLVNVRVTDVANNGALSSLNTYENFIQSNLGGLWTPDSDRFATTTDPLSVQLRIALQSAAAAGPAAEFFYVAAIAALIIQTISSITQACVAKQQGCARGNPLPAALHTRGAGVIIAWVGLICTVIATAISLSIYSATAAAGLAWLNSPRASALFFGTSALW